MEKRREQKFREVAARRQANLTVILENISDQHNIGAVMRSCDSVGIKEIFIVYSNNSVHSDKIKIGKRTSTGTRKWVDVHIFHDLETCLKAVRERYDLVLSTHLNEDSKGLYELDLTQSVALLFGNEQDGISEAALAHSDGNFIIPQMGMAESLNISVACAVTLYEALRQRENAGFYDQNPTQTPTEQEALYQDYLEKNKGGHHDRMFVFKKPKPIH